MPSPEQEALEVAKAAGRDEDGEWDWALFKAEYEKRLAERHKRLELDARAVDRAIDGWRRVEDQEHWHEIVRRAHDDYDRGRS
jgi:hypothetical protein